MENQCVTPGVPTDVDALIGGCPLGATAPAASLSDRLVEKINRRHAVVLNGGRVLIATWKPDGKIEFGPLQDLHTWYANVPYGDNGQPVSKWWLRQSKRRQYPGGVTFAPAGAPASTLNLWTGFAVKPAGGADECPLFLHHLRHVVCSGNKQYFDYVMGWLAHMVQHPGDKPGVALVLKGDRGVGKDAVGDYLAPIFGRHAFKLTKADSLTGRFNRHLGETLFLHVEEGFWAGDKAAESTLKSLVTSRELTIEAKGVDAINMPSFVRLFISSNEDWVVPSAHDERRWAVFEVLDTHKQHHSYFEELFRERDNGGTAALLSVLQGVNLSGFNVRDVPQTQALIDQKTESLTGIERWWHEVLVGGQLPCADAGNGFDGDIAWEDGAITVPREPLRGAFYCWAKENPKVCRPVTVQQFGRKLHELVPGIGTTQLRRAWHYVIPALGECREAFGERYDADYYIATGDEV